MSYIEYGGVTSDEIGLTVEHYPNIIHPSRKYDKYNVPGRNGDILIEQDAWNNYTQPYDVYTGTGERGSAPKSYIDFAAWLYMPNSPSLSIVFSELIGYAKSIGIQENAIQNIIDEWAGGYSVLYDTYEPDYFRMARFEGEIEGENAMSRLARSTIGFDCRPQRYMMDVMEGIELTPGVQKTIYNPTPFPAYPVIVMQADAELLTGYSNTITVNGEELKFNYSFETLNDFEPVVIDTELEGIYGDAGVVGYSFDTYLSGEYFTLQPGTNTIQVDYRNAGIFTGAKPKVFPRWWVI